MREKSRKEYPNGIESFSPALADEIGLRRVTDGNR
jgi:hypothetical protein